MAIPLLVFGHGSGEFTTITKTIWNWGKLVPRKKKLPGFRGPPSPVSPRERHVFKQILLKSTNQNAILSSNVIFHFVFAHLGELGGFSSRSL